MVKQISWPHCTSTGEEKKRGVIIESTSSFDKGMIEMLLVQLTCFLVGFPIPTVPWVCYEPLRSNSPHPPENLLLESQTGPDLLILVTLVGWSSPDIDA